MQAHQHAFIRSAHAESEPLTAAQRAALMALLKLTFESRRKMLRVSLRKLLDGGSVTAPPADVLTQRPEQLTPEDFLQLARTLFGEVGLHRAIRRQCE